MKRWIAIFPLLFVMPLAAADSALRSEIERRTAEVMPRVVEWRRHLHRNPELSKQEFKTAAYVADHLRKLGMEVRTGVGGTGVIGLLRGGKPGAVVALRADMDALPVTEATGLEFASKVRATYNDQEVGVMHACGHDAHVAILMGAAEVLSGMRAQLPGTVKFIFQPAEEGEGGAEAMIRDGVLKDPKPEAIFGLHVMSGTALGEIDTRAGGLMASSDWIRIVIRGKQTHGAYPWRGVDPIVTASQIVLALQTIASRQLDSTVAPAVISIGSIQGGLRYNIIPDEVTLIGTVRALDSEMRRDIHRRIERTAKAIAESAGATAEVEIQEGTDVTYNDPKLTEWAKPVLQGVAGSGRFNEVNPTVVAEDFSAYQKEIPGVFFFLGCRPEGVALEDAAPNHSPEFFVDEGALPVGVRALSTLAVEYLRRPGAASSAR